MKLRNAVLLQSAQWLSRASNASTCCSIASLLVLFFEFGLFVLMQNARKSSTSRQNRGPARRISAERHTAVEQAANRRKRIFPSKQSRWVDSGFLTVSSCSCSTPL